LNLKSSNSKSDEEMFVTRVYFYLGQVVRVTRPIKDSRGRSIAGQLAKIERLNERSDAATARVGGFRFSLNPTECEEIAPARRIRKTFR
jgi:hypothetical protein